MARPIAKWKIEENERIQKLDNKSLLEETLDLAAGDDYDGCMTDRGTYSYAVLTGELYGRLKDWLGDE